MPLTGSGASIMYIDRILGQPVTGSPGNGSLDEPYFNSLIFNFEKALGRSGAPLAVPTLDK